MCLVGAPGNASVSVALRQNATLLFSLSLAPPLFCQGAVPAAQLSRWLSLRSEQWRSPLVARISAEGEGEGEGEGGGDEVAEVHYVGRSFASRPLAISPLSSSSLASPPLAPSLSFSLAFLRLRQRAAVCGALGAAGGGEAGHVAPGFIFKDASRFS